MQHVTDDDLILEYYGEPGAAVGEHLAGCAECRERYRTLQLTLNAVDLPVPQRTASYGAEVWSRLEPKLGLRPGSPRSLFQRWIAIAAVALLAAAVFLGGRYLPQPQQQTAASPVRERILILAVGDHLDRSQVMLAELVNAEPQRGSLNIESERTQAESLLQSNRLYRQTAMATGDARTASLLDDIERVLLDIVNSPDSISAGDLESIRGRIEDEGLLFKIRVVGSTLRKYDAHL